MAKKRIVLALGGNALQKNGEVTAEAQKSVANEVGEIIAKLSDKYDIIVAHGNGPQVGNILIHEEQAATASAPAMPLETAVAMSEGQIGYWLSQAIGNAFRRRGIDRKVASIITQVVVDRKDKAFKHPTKPIGQFYTASEAKALSRKNHWIIKEDSGRGYRRVVPSPMPKDIVERHEIMDLVRAGAIVIAVGGGGIPVIKTRILGLLKGIDAVIDKDFAAAKLAELVDADIFVSVTSVPCAYINFDQPDQLALRSLSISKATEYVKSGYFKAGSMLPKIEAAISVAELGKTGIITSLEHLELALAGESGTIITAEG